MQCVCSDNEVIKNISFLFSWHAPNGFWPSLCSLRFQTGSFVQRHHHLAYRICCFLVDLMERLFSDFDDFIANWLPCIDRYIRSFGMQKWESKLTVESKFFASIGGSKWNVNERFKSSKALTHRTLSHVWYNFDFIDTFPPNLCILQQSNTHMRGMWLSHYTTIWLSFHSMNRTFR